jgi:hypothetical protein
MTLRPFTLPFLIKNKTCRFLFILLVLFRLQKWGMVRGGPQKAKRLTDKDTNKLYSCRQLGTSTPKVSNQHFVVLNILYIGIKCEAEENRQIKWWLYCP